MVRQHLASGAFHIRTKPTMICINEDVNGDGTYESVLKLRNPETGELETN